MTRLLEAHEIAAGYDGLPVISKCSLTVDERQCVALVGRNGVGKTTLVSAISGRLPLLEGRLTFAGTDISRLPSYKRSNLGIVHVPQGREVFSTLTVHENLLIASRGAAAKAEWELVYDLFPVLKSRLDQKAGTLSGGEQQMVAIGRAVLSRSKLMILDEPSLGLAPKVVEMVFERIKKLRESLEIALILVEQQARWIWESGMVDFVYVLADGTIATSGTPESLPEQAVQDSYLGKMHAGD